MESECKDVIVFNPQYFIYTLYRCVMSKHDLSACETTSMAISQTQPWVNMQYFFQSCIGIYFLISLLDEEILDSLP